MFRTICIVFGILGFLMPVSLAQETVDCTDEFIDAQIGLMTDDSYRIVRDEDKPASTNDMKTLAQKELFAYCNPNHAPLIDINMTVPIKTWVIATPTTPETSADEACFYGFEFDLTSNETDWELLELCEFESIAEQFDEDTNCFIGYVYVDHVEGISFDLQSFCDIADDDSVTITTSVLDAGKRFVFRYAIYQYLEITPLSHEQLMEFELPITPAWVYGYTTEDYDIIRADRELDPIRYEGYPDDISFYLFDNDRPDLQTELIFGRLEQQLDPPEFFLVELINEPFADYDVNLGDLVIVELTEYEGETIGVYIGKLDDLLVTDE